MTAYKQTGEEEISNNNLLTTIPHLNEEWSLAFEILPTMFYTTFKQFLNIRRNGEDFHPAFYMMNPDTWRVHFTGASSVDLPNKAVMDQWTESSSRRKGETPTSARSP